MNSGEKQRVLPTLQGGGPNQPGNQLPFDHTMLDESPKSGESPRLDDTQLEGTTPVNPHKQTQPYSFGGGSPNSSLPSSRVPVSVERGAAGWVTMRQSTLPRLQCRGDVPELVQIESERFEKIRHLGTGGVGEVCLYQDTDIGRTVAIKRLRPEHQSKESLIRFIEEIQAIGRLEHPNIIPIHDVGVDQTGQYYFVMKYVEGESLEEIVEKLKSGDPEYHRKFPFEIRQQIFLQILHALQYTHQNKTIHRDIKPSNIMVGPYGEVMVMDWGLAKTLDDSNVSASASNTEGPLSNLQVPRSELFKTRQGSLVGTPAYMSPEQAQGQNESLDERSDIYSLFVMLHEFLTLEHYLEHKRDLASMIHGVIHEDAPFASFQHNPHQKTVPAELSHFMAKGLQKNPDLRYQTINEVIVDLTLIAQGKFRVQCPVTCMKRSGFEMAHFSDNHPILAGLCMVAAVVSVGFTAIFLVLRAYHMMLPT
jgi:eukaryotic-like serine/threonine-protein kinase